MKICLVNSYFPPWRGGAETYVAELSKALALRGHKVSVVCAADPLQAGVASACGVRVIRLRRMTRVYGTPIMWKLHETLSQVGTEILHANFPSPYIAYNVARISTHRKVPAVLTWHNDLPPVTVGAGLLIAVHDHLILPHYIKKYKRIISTTETYVNHSRILSKLGSRVSVVPNGVDCQRFNPRNDGTQIKNQFNLKDRFTLLFVGALTRWHGYKGLDNLLVALSIAVNRGLKVVLLVIGDGSLKEEYQQLAHKLNVHRSVLFAGNVPDMQLPLYYAAADALALPSKNMSEGFGLTLLEANATGLPVVASRIGGIPSVVRDGYNGLLVEPGNAEVLAQAIARLIEHRVERMEMGRNGRHVAEGYDWSIVAAKTERVYLQATAAT